MKSSLYRPVPSRLRPHLLFTRSRSHHRLPSQDKLLRVMRGVYLRPVAGLKSWEQQRVVSLARAIGALQRVPSARCLTHTSAALVQGIEMWSQEPDVYLAVPSRPARAATPLPVFSYRAGRVPVEVDRPGDGDREVMLRRRALALEHGEIEVVGSVTVTTVLRTAFDCACDEPPHNALAIADSALRLWCEPDRRRPGDCSQRWAQARQVWDGLVARHPRRRGIAQARAVLTEATPWAESPGESLVRWIVLVLGLPRPVLQHRVDTRTRRRYIDLSWPELRIAIEYDGADKYQGMDDVLDEKYRQDDIHAQGWTFLRITAKDLRHMRELADRILALFPVDVVANLQPVADLVGNGLWGPAPEESLLA